MKSIVRSTEGISNVKNIKDALRRGCDPLKTPEGYTYWNRFFKLTMDNNLEICKEIFYYD